jgi:murein DD-endopeptidase MepM/ murein hydrolase activator NlpD
MNSIQVKQLNSIRTRLLLLTLALSLFLQPATFCQTPNNLLALCKKADSISVLVRDNKINKAAVLQQFQKLVPALSAAYYASGGKNFSTSAWVFPLQSYTAKAIGGANGNGYTVSGYNYYDGNKHGGHPAHDIFINDKNQDDIDDKTKSPVNVLSVTGGVVVSMETKWDTASLLKGGKYIWIFDPSTNSLFYYAHNSRVFVTIGQIVQPGDVIANVGRTGFNAFKKRSPTHLHFMRLVFDKDYYPRPVNPYNDLLKAKPK